MNLKLNLGCGFAKRSGYVNIDKEKACEPDLICDLEKRWPFEDNSVVEIRASHILEHLGATTEAFFSVIREMYRVCRDGALIFISVPHHDHWTFHADPTHVRKILPEGLRLFDQEFNRSSMASGDASSALGVYLDVDFVIDKAEPSYDEPWASRIQNGLCLKEDLEFASRHYTNCIAQWDIVWRVRKS